MVSAAVNVLGQQTYQFLNPNGFYCLKVDVNVKSQTKIELACQAQTADNKVRFNVLSRSRPTVVVGVHVMSDVNVVRVGGSKNCG